MKDLVALLRSARCPNGRCDNKGTITRYLGEGMGVEPEQCQWCDERETAIRAAVAPPATLSSKTVTDEQCQWLVDAVMRDTDAYANGPSSNAYESIRRWFSDASGHETSTEPSVIGAGAGLAPMPTAAEGVDACVRLIQKICAENGFDPAQWLNDETAQSGEKPPCPHCLEAHALIDAEPCDAGMSHFHTETASLPRGSMHFAFVLTMPNNNAWNGKWTGEGKLYARVRSGTSREWKQRMATRVGNHYYNFGDGWGANVEVKVVTAEEKRKLVKASLGFCGYEWMIESLALYGKIMNDNQREKHLANKSDELVAGDKP